MFGNNPLPNIGPITFVCLPPPPFATAIRECPYGLSEACLSLPNYALSSPPLPPLSSVATSCPAPATCSRQLPHHTPLPPLLSLTATSHPALTTALVNCHVTPCTCPTLSSAATSPPVFAPAATSHTTMTPIDNAATHTCYLAPPLIEGCGRYVFSGSFG